jgi:hypothetical protein
VSDKWLADFQSSFANARYGGRDVVVIDMAGQAQSPDLIPLPPSRRVYRLTHAGQHVPAITVNIPSGEEEFHLCIEADENLTSVQIPRDLKYPLVISGAGPSHLVSLETQVLPSLIVRNCSVAAEATQNHPETTLRLDNATLKLNISLELQVLSLAGEVGLLGGQQVIARELVLAPSVTLIDSILQAAGDVFPAGPVALRRSTLSLASPRSDLTFAMERPSVLLIERHAVPFRNLTVLGAGDLSIRGRLLAARLNGPDQAIRVSLSDTAELEGSSNGMVNLSAEARSTLTATSEGAFRLGTVEKVAGAEIAGVNVFQRGLSYSDLRELGRAERFVPYIPRNRRTARQAVDEVFPREGLKRRKDAKEIQRLRRVHHWASTLADTVQVQESSAPGAIQSRARYLEFWSRRRAIEFGDEKVLLALYSIVGYGESILRPAIWLGILALTVPIFLIHPSPYLLAMDGHVMTAFRAISSDWHTYLTHAAAVVFSPLAFFARTEPQPYPLGGSTLGRIAVQVVTFLLWLFVILAARRVAKADRLKSWTRN